MAIAIGSNGVAQVAPPTPSNTVSPTTFRLQRKLKKNTDLSDKVDNIIEYVLKGRLNSDWSGDGTFTSYDSIDIAGNNTVTQTFEFTFKYISNKAVDHDLVDRQIKQIRHNITSAFKSLKVPGEWNFVDAEGLPISGGLGDDSESILYPTWDQFADIFLNRLDPLWDAPYDDINDHQCFSHIFGLEHVIRMAIRTIHHAATTRGKHCAHLLLHGLPGGAKTTVIDALIDYVNYPIIQWNPEYRAVLKIDADSSTQAGITNRIIQLANGIEGCPIMVAIEEAEKCDASMWKGLLSVFDARQRLTKLNARRDQKAYTPILGVASVNNLPQFDGFLSGAVSSRFSNRIEVPRPTPDTMEKILLYRIDEIGGEREWAHHAMAIAHKYRLRDPRQILNLLVGENSLLDGTFEEDYARNMAAAEDVKRQYERAEGDLDAFMDSLYK